MDMGTFGVTAGIRDPTNEERAALSLFY